MTLKWLGPGYFGSKVAPGDDMPKIDKKRLEKFIKLGKVGTIAEKIDLEKIKSDKIKELENDYVNKCIKFEATEKAFNASELMVGELQKEIESFVEQVDSEQKEIADLVKENTGLKNKVSDFEKEIADLVKVSKKKDK